MKPNLAKLEESDTSLRQTDFLKVLARQHDNIDIGESRPELQCTSHLCFCIMLLFHNFGNDRILKALETAEPQSGNDVERGGVEKAET